MPTDEDLPHDLAPVDVAAGRNDAGLGRATRRAEVRDEGADEVVKRIARRVWHALRCRLGRHDWTVTTAAGGGIAVGIMHCAHCPKIDVDRIAQTLWNRAERRRVRRHVRRAV